MLGTIRVVKADAGEVDENVSLPKEEEETTDPGEGEGGGDGSGSVENGENNGGR